MFNRIFLIFLLCAWTAVNAMADDGKNSANIERIFQIVDALIKALPVRTDSLQKLTGEKFARDPNSYWIYGECLVSISPGAGIFKTVHACVPKNGLPKGSPSGKVFLDIKPDTPIKIKQVEKHFGKSSVIDPRPYTDLPPSQEPIAYVYNRPWGKLVFECDPKSNVVHEICLNAEN